MLVNTSCKFGKSRKECTVGQDYANGNLVGMVSEIVIQMGKRVGISINFYFNKHVSEAP